MVAEWTERRTLVTAVAPRGPMRSVEMKWWGPGARG